MRNILKMLGCVIALILFTNFRCEKDLNTLLTIQNNGDMTVVAYLTNNYPDTLLPTTGYELVNTGYGYSNHYTRVYAWSSADFVTVGITQHEYFMTNDTFQVFFIKRELCPLTNSDITFNDVYKNNWILRRCVFSRDDLAKMNWVVTFP